MLPYAVKGVEKNTPVVVSYNKTREMKKVRRKKKKKIKKKERKKKRENRTNYQRE